MTAEIGSNHEHGHGGSNIDSGRGWAQVPDGCEGVGLRVSRMCVFCVCVDVDTFARQWLQCRRPTTNPSARDGSPQLKTKSQGSRVDGGVVLPGRVIRTEFNFYVSGSWDGSSSHQHVHRPDVHRQCTCLLINAVVPNLTWLKLLA